eukprot:Awhi_evm1s14627
MASVNKKCGICAKTVYPTEKIDVGVVFHKACFRCQEKSCNCTLSLQSHQLHEGIPYCSKHVPKPSSTAVADSVAMKSALNAPKKVAEGLNKTVVAEGKPTAVTDSLDTQRALNAPKKVAEGLNKTVVAEGKPTAVTDSVDNLRALNAPKKVAEDKFFGLIPLQRLSLRLPFSFTSLKKSANGK